MKFRFGKLKSLLTLTAFVLAAITIASSIPTGKLASYSGAAKPMEFYFHYSDAPVSVAGLQTKYIINTTRLFRFSTLEEAYANSFYKPIGLPKIDVDFYLYPNLAGPVTLNGSWQVFI